MLNQVFVVMSTAELIRCVFNLFQLLRVIPSERLGEYDFFFHLKRNESYSEKYCTI